MKRFLISLLPVLTSVSLLPVPLYAIDVVDQCDGVENSPICDELKSSNRLFGAGSLFEAVLQIVIFVVGAVAILMIIIGGLKYVLSGGDSNATQSAKNTILYALIGLVVAVVAQALLSFVLNRII